MNLYIICHCKVNSYLSKDRLGNQGVSAHQSTLFSAAKGLIMAKYWSCLFTHKTVRTGLNTGRNLPIEMGKYHMIPRPVLERLYHLFVRIS